MLNALRVFYFRCYEHSGGTGEVSRRRAWLEILLLLLLIGIGGLAVVLLEELFVGWMPLPVLLALQGAVILAGLSILLFRAGQRWSDVGLHALNGRDVGRALVLLVECVAVNLILMLIIYRVAPEHTIEHMIHLQGIASRLAGEQSILAIAATMFFVGIYEELTARGFLLTRCRTALDGVWAPVLLSSMLFGLGHAYQGWIGMAQTTLIGTVLAVNTVRWGTLWPAILAHALLNTFSVATLAEVKLHP